jgi:hypothetical protein
MDGIILMAPVIVIGICGFMAFLAWLDERPPKERRS